MSSLEPKERRQAGPYHTRRAHERMKRSKEGEKRGVTCKRAGNYQMEEAEAEAEAEENGGGGGGSAHWWWAVATTAQLGLAISSIRKGYAGDAGLMPLKAFAVASLFVGAGSTAALSFLQASGIHKVEDMMEAGANIRTRLGIRPRDSG